MSKFEFPVIMKAAELSLLMRWPSLHGLMPTFPVPFTSLLKCVAISSLPWAQVSLIVILELVLLLQDPINSYLCYISYHMFTEQWSHLSDVLFLLLKHVLVISSGCVPSIFDCIVKNFLLMRILSVVLWAVLKYFSKIIALWCIILFIT